MITNTEYRSLIHEENDVLNNIVIADNARRIKDVIFSCSHVCKYLMSIEYGYYVYDFLLLLLISAVANSRTCVVSGSHSPALMEDYLPVYFIFKMRQTNKV